MAYTNSTPYYNLPQYVGTDIPNPLTDFNGAMSTIDTTMHDIASGVGDNDNAIRAIETQNGSDVLTTTAQTLSGAVNELDGEINDNTNGLTKRVGDLETKVTADEGTLSTAVGNISTISGKVANLETQNGNAVLTTTAQTLSGAINELDYDLGTTDGKVGALETQNGNSVLTTTAQTLSGAVNELKSAIDAIPTSTIDTAMSDSSTNAVQNKVIKAYVDSKVVASAEEKQSGTLTTGQTSVVLTFSDVTIGSSTLIDVYTDTFGVNPTAIATTSSTVTLTFDAQASDVAVAVVAKN